MEDMRGLQQHDRRVKPPPPENQQPQQPQKCPRCQSFNTKFCYYNNYSLSQPRYFCKACRRYWTQGGTLRNVPVGGGCRKGKRPKRPSTADNLQNQLPPPPQPNSVTTSTTVITTTTSPMPPIPPGPASIYYPSGGFFSPLAAFQSINQPMSVGAGDFGVSNLALLQGFSLPSLSSQQQLQQENAIQANRPSTSHQEWNQSFINGSNSIKSEAGYWTSSSNNNTSGTSLNPSQWGPDLPGYCPQPPSSSQSFL